MSETQSAKPEARRAFQNTPFTRRWNDENLRAMKSGGWHVHSAPSQYGKSTANRGFLLAEQRARRGDGDDSVPVAQCWATESKNILRGIAESIGGERMANQPNRHLLVSRVMARLKTRLVIVNNGHNMGWGQWQELLDLDEISWTQHGFRPAVVLSGVHREVSIVNPPKNEALVEQIHKRIVCYREVSGLGRDEIEEALVMFVRRDCPGLMERRIKTYAGRVFEILTEPLFDPWHRGTVGCGDLVELVRRIAGAHAERPTAALTELIDRAADDYRSAQRPPVNDQKAQIGQYARAMAQAEPVSEPTAVKSRRRRKSPDVVAAVAASA